MAPNKQVRIGIVAAVCLIFLILPRIVTATVAESVQVCFAPPQPGGCDPTQTVVQTLSEAHRQVLVQAYSFTSAPIAKALVAAHKRGVEVSVILDRSNDREGYSAAKFLEHERVPVMIDSQHAIAHNKVMVIDGETVITGSFNFTRAAEERNAENLVVIHSDALAKQYGENWKTHAAHSQLVSGAYPKAAEQPPARKLPEEPRAGQIVGNKKSHVYAWPECGNYDSMSPKNRIVFGTRTAAESAGYRAARNCP
jgi:phosphatidylserine/phosphatidylglycerophosphate/cardiolipin synthase-like enzyme